MAQEILLDIGRELARRRQTKGLTIDELSEKTKISRHFIEAMENGSFDFLPLTYVRAFLRTYALEVGLDPDVMVRQLELAVRKQQETAPEIDASHPAESEVQKEPHGESTTIVEDIKGFYYFFRPFLFAALAIIIIIILIVTSSTEKKSEQKIKTSVQSNVTETQPTEGRQTAGESFWAKGEVAISSHPLWTLKIVATDTTWLRIVFDDSLADEAVFLPGDVRTWSSRSDFYLKLGNAGGVELYLNDKKLGIPGKPGSVANVLVNNEGIRHIPNSALPAVMNP